MASLNLAPPAKEPEESALPNPDSRLHAPDLPKPTALFSFVDLKDPFVAGELADEVLLGPILSILSAKRFDHLFLFHTPHTVRETNATVQEVLRRLLILKADRLHVRAIPTSDPKDFSVLLGSVTAILRDQNVGELQASVCVSSGTAEMRATWFLLNALSVLPATLLQVGSPADPLFGPANVKEVRLDSENWQTIRQLAMPWQYFTRAHRHYPVEERAAALSRILGLQRTLRPSPHTTVPSQERSAPERDLELEKSKEFKLDKHELPEQQKQTPTAGDSHSPRSSRERSLEWESPDRSEETAEIFGELTPPRHEHAQPASAAASVLAGLDDALQELGIHIGSAAMRFAAQRAGIAAESDLPILLTGETGTGKERFAQLIHRLSPRSSAAFLAVNCAAIPDTLAESYLFGHTKGAFSGAVSDKPGIFESADGATLFLDEIAELSLETQAKLLRVIQDGVVQRLGATKSRQVEVRLVAATNRDLKKEVSAGRFREDLYFRLEVVQIRLPALRERPAEIAGLALALLKQMNQRRKRQRQLSKAALRRLEDYHWPGNVRQLSNVLERSVLYAPSDILGPADLLITDGSPGEDPLVSLPDPVPGFSLENYLDQVRKQLFLRALSKSNNNQAEAAALLGISKQAVNKFVTGLNDNSD